MKNGHRKHLSRSPEETMEIAGVFARSLRPGAVLALEGSLGSGKTVFIKGLVQGLGLRDTSEVTSPTFVLMHVYKTQTLLYHFDLYRLNRLQDLVDIGFDEFVNDEGAISAIEWADKAKGMLPKHDYRIKFRIKGETAREILIRKGKVEKPKIRTRTLVKKRRSRKRRNSKGTRYL